MYATLVVGSSRSMMDTQKYLNGWYKIPPESRHDKFQPYPHELIKSSGWAERALYYRGQEVYYGEILGHLPLVDDARSGHCGVAGIRN